MNMLNLDNHAEWCSVDGNHGVVTYTRENMNLGDGYPEDYHYFKYCINSSCMLCGVFFFYDINGVPMGEMRRDGKYVNYR